MFTCRRLQFLEGFICLVSGLDSGLLWRLRPKAMQPEAAKMVCYQCLDLNFWVKPFDVMSSRIWTILPAMSPKDLATVPAQKAKQHVNEGFEPPS